MLLAFKIILIYSKMSILFRHLKKTHSKSMLSDQRKLFPDCIYNIDKNKSNIHVGEIADTNIFKNIQDPCLYLLINLPNQGLYLPRKYECLNDIINKAILYESSINPDLRNYYIYLTVDNRPIEYMKSQRTSKWHIEQIQDGSYHGDAGRTYIITDRFGPLYVPITEKLSSTINLSRMNSITERTDLCGREIARSGVDEMLPYCLYCFDQTYLIRDRINYFQSYIYRTMIKITITPLKFNRMHHSRNDMIIYQNWPTFVPRYECQLNLCFTNDIIDDQDMYYPDHNIQSISYDDKEHMCLDHSTK